MSKTMINADTCKLYGTRCPESKRSLLRRRHPLLMLNIVQTSKPLTFMHRSAYQANDALGDERIIHQQ